MIKIAIEFTDEDMISAYCLRDEIKKIVPDGVVIVKEEQFCRRCGYTWMPETEDLPKTCPNPKCRSPYWSKPRTKGIVASAEPK